MVTIIDHSPVITEERRQRAVESLGLQVDVPEERFDRITRLAHHLFDVPISTITVVDGDVALFPGQFGLARRSMGREMVLCTRTHLGETVVIEDLADHPELEGHPIRSAFGIRFYAGRPLVDPQGNVVGTLALFDTRPRALSPEMRAAFDDIATWAQQELVASTEMTQATRVQTSMLPDAPIRQDDWEIQGLCRPSLAVGGDFFDYGVIDDVAHVALGDVMGKGTAAALVGAGVRSALRGAYPAICAGVDLGVSATQVARSLHEDLERAESFVTLSEMVIDLDDGWVRYVDAGSGLALLVRAGGEAIPLSGSDSPFGIWADDHWSEHQTTMASGDTLLLFSDGLLDLIEDPAQWWFEVAELVRAHPVPHDLLSAIERLAREQTVLDDVTAVVIHRRATTR